MVLMLLIFTSCSEELIDIDLTDYRNTIVIEGIMANNYGPHRVRISKAKYIFESSASQMVSDASVTITDNLGNIAVLEESEPGLYETSSITGIPGRVYTLEVIAEGKVYTAASVMPQPLELEMIRFQRISSNTPEYSLYSTFQDREGVDDFCRINFYRNGYYLSGDMILYQGEYTDGEEIVIDDLKNYFYRLDRVNIEVISLNRNIFDYYYFLENSLPEDDGDNETTDIIEFGYSNPKSNISNGALGFFSAQSYTNYSRVVR
jgi:hypothetical protein